MLSIPTEEEAKRRATLAIYYALKDKYCIRKVQVFRIMQTCGLDITELKSEV